MQRNLRPFRLRFLSLIGLMACGVMILSSVDSARARRFQSIQAADEWGIGEVVGERVRFLFDPNDTDGDGIKDAEEGDGPGVGSYGANASKDPSLCSLETKDGRVSMKIDRGYFRNVRLVSENDPNRPDKSISDPEFPYGFISFRIEGLDSYGKDEVNLKILFPAVVSAHARLCRYHDQQWRAQIVYDIGEGYFWKYDFDALPESYHRRSIALTLRDNDSIYDADIQEVTGNQGRIEGCWGLGVPKSSSGKGRCFIQVLSGQ